MMARFIFTLDQYFCVPAVIVRRGSSRFAAAPAYASSHGAEKSDHAAAGHGESSHGNTMVNRRTVKPHGESAGDAAR